MDNREEILTELKALGGKVSNRVLYECITQRCGTDPWTPDYYINVREALKDEGLIKLGRGRGGTVILTEGTNV